MHVIAMLGQKGGAGKTTIAVHLAVAAQQDGVAVALIDTDPQGTASSWIKSRTAKNPTSASAPPIQVHAILEVARQSGISLVVVDTAPHADVGATRAVEDADIILMPCRPTAFDVAGIAGAVRIARVTGRRSAFVLNACPPRGYEPPQTARFLESLGYPVAPQTIGQRQAYARATASGQAVTEFDPRGTAADEIRTLWNWVKDTFANEETASRHRDPSADGEPPARPGIPTAADAEGQAS